MEPESVASRLVSAALRFDPSTPSRIDMLGDRYIRSSLEVHLEDLRSLYCFFFQATVTWLQSKGKHQNGYSNALLERD